MPDQNFARIFRHRAAAPLLCAGLLFVHAALLLWSARVNSVAFDEYAHLPAGVAYWEDRAFSIYNASPPLLRMIAALPVMVSGPNVPPPAEFASLPAKDRHWSYGEAFMRANADRYHKLFVTGRLAMSAVSCLGGWIVYRWARAMYGPTAGVASCALYAFCPNLLAHASLVGTDAGTATAFIAVGWLWWRYCRQPSWQSLTLAAMAMGIAHLCKFSALLLWPALLATTLIEITSTKQFNRRALRRFAIAISVVLLATLLMVNLGYAFQRTGQRVASFSFQSRALSALADPLPGWLPIPLPRELVAGLDAMKWEMEHDFQAYLAGGIYRGAKWYYFPVALLAKLPLGTIAVLAFATASMLIAARRRNETRRDAGAWVWLIVIFVGTILLAELNLGVRYILPALPFAFVVAGRCWAGDPEAPPVTRSSRLQNAATVGALLVGVETLLAAPRFLPFFNIAAGGPGGGYLLLSDSNVDWGQGLIDLRSWMRDNRVERVYLGYFGRTDPAVYGINYVPLNQPSSDRYVAVSSYYLTGMAHRMPTANGASNFVRINFAEELRREQPVAIVGDVLFVFERADVSDALQRWKQRQ